MDADLLKTFLAVIHAGSFIGAANRIGRTQSAVSQQIQRLESLLGGPLMTRNSRALRLTAAGERFAEYARRIVALEEEACRAVQGLAVQQSLRFGVVEDLAGFGLGAVLQRLRAEAPLLRLDIRSAPTGELLAELGFRYDVVVGIRPAGARGGQLLAELPLCWLGAWQGGSVPLALHPEGCSMRHAAIRTLDDAGIDWQPAMVTDGLLPAIAVVRAGLAVTVLAEAFCPPDLPRCTGLPPLPPLSLRLFVDEDADGAAVGALARILEETLAAPAQATGTPAAASSASAVRGSAASGFPAGS